MNELNGVTDGIYYQFLCIPCKILLWWEFFVVPAKKAQDCSLGGGELGVALAFLPFDVEGGISLQY